MAEHVSDDVALMRTQCQIRRLEIAMNWAPRGSSRPDTSSFWDSCRRYEFFQNSLGRCIRSSSLVNLGIQEGMRNSQSDNASGIATRYSALVGGIYPTWLESHN